MSINLSKVLEISSSDPKHSVLLDIVNTVNKQTHLNCRLDEDNGPLGLLIGCGRSLAFRDFKARCADASSTVLPHFIMAGYEFRSLDLVETHDNFMWFVFRLVKVNSSVKPHTETPAPTES